MSQRVSLFEVQYFPTHFTLKTLKRSERSFAKSWILSTKEIIEVGKKTFSCLMSDTAFPRQQVAPNKVFKRRLLIYNRFVHGLIYGFWRRSVCKIIWDYQMDFEKCNKIINYLDYPNGAEFGAFTAWQTVGSMTLPDTCCQFLPWQKLIKHAKQPFHDSLQPLVNSQLFQTLKEIGTTHFRQNSTPFLVTINT